MTSGYFTKTMFDFCASFDWLRMRIARAFRGECLTAFARGTQAAFGCLLCALFLLQSDANAAEFAPQTKNVFLIVTDGFRWQEVFTGAEEALLNKTNGGVRNAEGLRKKFWRDTPEARRE